MTTPQTAQPSGLAYPQTGETTAYHGLSCQCHQQRQISTLTYKQGPTNIPILKYYWEMRDVIICPCIQCSTWMDRCHQLLVLSRGKETNYHTHYTVGGKCIHHQHIMDAGNTLREFDALKQAL